MGVDTKLYISHRFDLQDVLDVIEHHVMPDVFGILVSKVNPAYTSQKCSVCGHIDKGNRKGLEFFCLSCGYGSNADFNAARNIANLGVYSLQGPESRIY